MESKKTRVEISPELNELLNEYIDEQKDKGSKSLSKIKVLEQLCKAGLAFQNQSDLDGLKANVVGDAGVKQPVPLYPNEYIPETKSELKAMQEALYQKEHRLIEKEQFLLKKESILNKKHFDAISYYENSLNKKSDDSIKSALDKMKYDSIMDKIHNGNEKLRDEIKNMNRDLMKILREIKRNTQENKFYDKVLPILTTIGVGVNTFQQLTKDKNFKLDTVLNDLIGGISKPPKTENRNITKDGNDSDKNTGGKKKEGK